MTMSADRCSGFADTLVCSETPLLVGDAKWKTHDTVKRTDLYQLFPYQQKSKVPGLLIYPDGGQPLPNKYEFETDHSGPPNTFKLEVSDKRSYELTKQQVTSELTNAVLCCVSQNTLNKT